MLINFLFFFFFLLTWLLLQRIAQPRTRWTEEKNFFSSFLLFTNNIRYAASIFQFSSVQSLCHVWLFVIPWSTACQASLSIINSWSLLKLMSIESVMPSNHLILDRPVLLLPSIFSSFYLASQQSPGIWDDSPRPWSIRSYNRYIYIDSIVYHLTCGRVWNRHSFSVPNILRIFSIITTDKTADFTIIFWFSWCHSFSIHSFCICYSM